MIKEKGSPLIKLLMYMVALVLINLVSLNLFFRVDLTDGGVYTLSAASESLVESLSEPLTFKVFFTKNLPAPYNNIERYLQDLLLEYAASGGRFFNYQFYDVSSGDEEAAKENQELARTYGISPVQIQNIEQDEVKFQKAYMGMAMIHGDIIETIPAIISTDGLEYKITSTIRKMSRKMNTLLGLDEKIKVRLYMSSSLKAVGPYINVEGISELPDGIRKVVSELNDSNYGRISFEYHDPSMNKDSEKEAGDLNVLALNWDAFQDRRGIMINADKGYIGLVVQHGDQAEIISLINVVRIPIFGTQYQLYDESEIKNSVEEAIENLVQVNEEIGYLADHGTPGLGFSSPMLGMPDTNRMNHFNKLLSEQYTVKNVSLESEGIPEGLPSLIIAGPRESFSDYTLYQIDQFLMKGKNLAIFLDSFEEVIPPQQNQAQMMFQRPQPFYQPLNTGIEKLLGHYGVTVKKSIAMDDSSFKQRVPEPFGGGEQQVFYAPIIKKGNINNDFPFLKNVKGLVMYKNAPVEVDEEKLEKSDIKAYELFSSSAESWEMEGRIDFNPMFARKPPDEEAFKPLPLAYLLEGEFVSYFADKPVPEKPIEKDENGEGVPVSSGGIDTSRVVSEGITIKRGKPGRLFVIGSSEILRDNILSETGDSPNSQFIFNVLDYLNGREDYAVMRSKTQSFNPLDDVPPNVRALIKGFNIIGLPVFVVLVGIAVWVKRSMRKRLIKQIFMN